MKNRQAEQEIAKLKKCREAEAAPAQRAHREEVLKARYRRGVYMKAHKREQARRLIEEEEGQKA